MSKKHWIFPAITCLLLSFLFLDELQFKIIFLILFWLIRIIFIKDRSIIVHTILISFFFLIVLFFHKAGNTSDLIGTENKFIVYPKVTSIQVDGNYLQFDGKVLSETRNGQEKIVINYYFEQEQEKNFWKQSPSIDYLIIEGNLERPSRNSNFYQFNYRKYLQRNNIYWTLQADSIQLIDNSTLKKPVFHFIDKWRMNLLSYIDQHFHEQPANYIKTLFLADKREFSKKATQDYRVLGVLHLFSISGFHITFLAQKLRLFLLKIGISHERSNLLIIVVLPFYGLVAGLGISVFRAVFQSIFLLLGKITNNSIEALDAWSLVMLTSLFLNPYHVYDIAFQLSYMISGILIILTQKNWIQKLNPFLSALLFSLVSTLISMPILIYHFHEISWITIFANLLFIPFFSFFLFPFLLFMFLTSIFLKKSKFFILLNYLSTFIIQMLEKIISILTETFDFTLVTGHLPALFLILLTVCIFKLIVDIEQKNRLSKSSLLIIISCLFYHQLSPVGYVLMIDVGQGDSFAIKEPYSNKLTMIDTGGRVAWQQKEIWKQREKDFSIGSDIVVPSLKAFGISKITRLYISHAHEDHMGEINSINEHLPIHEIAASRSTLQAENMMGSLARLNKTSIIECKSPSKVDLPTKKSFVLHPNQEYESKNNQSLVLCVKIGEDFWMFTGDMEEEAEREFIATYPQLNIDYLKVGHHGSQTSSTEDFIKHIHPKNALISVGENNTYGHPNVEVIERLKKSNIHINSTAEDGAVIIKYFKIPFVDYWHVKKETVY